MPNTTIFMAGSTKTCQEKLIQYKQKSENDNRPIVEPIQFLHTPDLKNHLQKSFGQFEQSDITFYNPTRPINLDKKQIIAVRVEPKSDESLSKVMFFENKGGEWQIINDSPVLSAQDPFLVPNVNGFNILGVVQTYPDKIKTWELSYRTAFYRFKNDINEIDPEKPFATSPDKMKDVRLIALPNGKIALFTRPQGGIYGPGKVAYTEIDSLDQLEAAIPNAVLIEGIFDPCEWGGVNDLHILKNGKIGIIGHIAQWGDSQKEIKNYYAAAGQFDPRTKQMSEWEIIASADDIQFPIGRKNNSIGNIVFAGGATRHIDGTIDLYAGINDVTTVKYILKDPFLKYEEFDARKENSSDSVLNWLDLSQSSPYLSAEERI